MENINKVHKLKKKKKSSPCHSFSCFLVTISSYVLYPPSPAAKSESTAKLGLACSLHVVSVGRLLESIESNLLCAPRGKLKPRKGGRILIHLGNNGGEIRTQISKMLFQ